MLVRNENFQMIELNDMVSDIVNEFDENPTIQVSEEEAKNALAQMYINATLVANQHYFKNKAYAMPVAEAEAQKTNFIKEIWNDLLVWVCPKIDEHTEREKIAEKVAEFVANLVIANIIVKPLLKILIFYVLKSGHTILCKTV